MKKNNIDKKKNKDRKKLSGIGLSGKILLTVVTPLVLVGIMVTIMFGVTLSDSTDKDVVKALKGNALTVLTAYNQNPGDYIVGADKRLWKGNFNICASKDLIESIGDAAGIDIFFYGTDKCMVSTIDNIEKTNMNFPKDIAKTVIDNKYDYASYSYNVNGEKSYVYAVTVFQERSDEVVGMIVVSSSVDSRRSSMNNVMSSSIIAIIIAIIISLIVAYIIVKPLIVTLDESVKNIEKVSLGKLNVTINDRLLKRKDEIGTMINSVVKLVRELRRMIEKSIAQTHKLQETAKHLDQTANRTKDSIEQVNLVMSETADMQYKTSNKVINSVDELKARLMNVYDEMQILNNTKEDMQLEGNKVKEVVGELIYINEALNKVISLVSNQIEKTHISAKEIRKSAELIASFADETNLLSLNASIEAVRVGEEGKGFAIVAKQIKELADQSTVVSSNITDEINELVQGSNMTLKSMKEVNSVVGKMNESIEITDHVFGKINTDIGIMSGNVEEVKTKINEMERVSELITHVIDELKEAANKNSNCVSKTSTVVDYMSELFAEASRINSISGELVESMKVFEL